MAMLRALSRNIPYLKQQFGALLEIHFWEVLVDIITVGLCGKLIEPLWGQMEMLTFFAIVNFGVAVITTAFYFILYCCTFNTEFLFTVHIHGLAGYIAGVSVAVKQIMPDLVIIKTPLGKLSNRNIPLTVFFLSVIFKLVGLVDGTYPTMFFSGLVVSWVYLRFYQKHTNGTRGDMADYFTFASFFPNVIQPPIAVLSNSIHSGLVRLGICRKVKLTLKPTDDIPLCSNASDIYEFKSDSIENDDKNDPNFEINDSQSVISRHGN
ncbi:hypothetical protein NQ314_004053 [Rhamnusium bicolor]|uniref:Transmembrane protein 115 n=1 Tax=Rhamnusium bicolor TaxID=1586634 RepID=A0AAV8ZKT7_9CUCU|nr:hypothetical protein NQ314_004053 [Rhamnusium bicolor]